ncbi:hypothetical protein [Methylobacterium sp. WL9]|uniref:hypothetical protein n=1 Tax=Methylobacterium sp. WL9 TaxID=2603898 RepID=UPI0011CB69B3|nr:hypothetical protein [Methylobacterium sp. WL9]TXN22883.1 hypothetical protein FV217_09190 [Methylobacterium sp. WL9]
MSTQFLHISLYGPQPRKGEPAWASIGGIVQEGARAPGAARHVPYPAAPTILYGVTPIEVGRIALERAGLARDTRGRRLRCDGAVLVAAVLSYPVRRDLVEDRDAPDASDLYSAWRAEAVAWCQSQFGDALLSVVEHADEDYPHLHAYAVPALGLGDRLQLEAIHPGRAALKKAEDAGADKKTQRAAYLGAMRATQDDYHTTVGAKFGHARVGPKRARLARTEHLVLRDAQQGQARLEQEYEAAQAHLYHTMATELTQRFATELAEARQQTQAIAQAHDQDQRRIAALLAECARLRDVVQSLEPDLEPSGGYSR